MYKASSPSECEDDKCNPLFLTLKNPQISDTDIYVLGAYQDGDDPLGQFSIQVSKKQADTSDTQNNDIPAEDTLFDEEKPQLVTYLDKDNPGQAVAIETGYTDKNTWLDWIRYSAKTHNLSDCIACATARPQLGTMPFPLNPLNDPSGYDCMIQLYLKQTDPNCTSLSLFYPEHHWHRGCKMRSQITRSEKKLNLLYKSWCTLFFTTCLHFFPAIYLEVFFTTGLQ
uniref:Uncharacterized protein n=1 Tax=Esox lucius TaxID=8010 RepID=A0AAY5K6U3_ESOLU